jgi:uncharacterized protein
LERLVFWTWDTIKAEKNKRTHGVSFELAHRVFGDPFALTVQDPFEAEERWRTIGNPSADFPNILFVVHTWNDEANSGRIISAREATKAERWHYENG